MSDLNWINTYGFIGIRLFDLPSFLICVLLVLILGYRFKVSGNYQIVLVLHCFLPFLLNGVLFDASYMPDQFKYWKAVNEIRLNQIGIFEALNSNENVVEASALLSLIPLPTPVSVISLGFYNTILYILLFFKLYTKNIFTNVSIWLYLLFPSAALYSALGLRDTLIFVLMTLAILYARESNVLKSSLCLLPLFLIKFQNFFILTPIVLLYFVFKVAKNGMGLGKAFIIALIGMIGLIASAPFAIPQINYFRAAMYREDGGEGEVELITGVSDFVMQGLTSGFYFLAKPFPWEASGLLPLIQSLENTVLLIILYLITRQGWKKSPDKIAFWLLFLAFSMSIYGLVVFNYGTAVRYRYPFIMIYTLFVCADCNIQKLLPERNKLSS